MRNLDRSAFAEKINELRQAISITGKVYHSIRVYGSKVRFIRQGKGRAEAIDFEELYSLYKNVPNPTNKEAREYIKGRVQSPAVSIINSLGSSYTAGLSSAGSDTSSKRAGLPISIPPISARGGTQKAETRFFQAFSNLIGSRYLISKSIGKPITGGKVFLTDDYRNYHFPAKVERNFEKLLTELNSGFVFKGKSLAHFSDGMLYQHPQLGTRIIEFDEEKHFTPALAAALKHQHEVLDLAFSTNYLKLLHDTDYLNDAALKKHRLKLNYDSYPRFAQFLKDIEDANESGYIKAKNGFPFLGGRVAQRAYYDCLRNAANLSTENHGYEPILRFPKKYFEDAAQKDFSRIAIVELTTIIAKYLQEIYEIDVN